MILPCLSAVKSFTRDAFSGMIRMARERDAVCSRAFPRFSTGARWSKSQIKVSEQFGFSPGRAFRADFGGEPMDPLFPSLLFHPQLVQTPANTDSRRFYLRQYSKSFQNRSR